ncbi:phosphopentomutase [Secundilactobacillus oryzae JCM 18671]|uniref:Phosphopentomutase n=1 Tax=Secundilactobacillus oryzae JCM 18671 TaxID=1291743 RepID=A0A081BHU6_9LACO|nr:hypothetical protein [Secundilactobacillus oryzae]GAK47614.1 phosphopentomutase [Secundilactobacillus oryzae JCM 18671]
MTFRRIFVIDLGAMGIGEAPDANRFNSIGSDSLARLDEATANRLTLPTLTQLGLGNLREQNPLQHVEPVDQPVGFYGKIRPDNANNNFASGIRESWDMMLDGRTTSVFDYLANRHEQVLLASPLISYLSNQASTKRVLIHRNQEALQLLAAEIGEENYRLSYIQLPEFQYDYNPASASELGDLLMVFDSQLELIMRVMKHSDLLLITANHSADPHHPELLTREYLPLFAYTPAIEIGRSLGIKKSMADLGATILDNFGFKEGPGTSFISELH